MERELETEEINASANASASAASAVHASGADGIRSAYVGTGCIRSLVHARQSPRGLQWLN